METKQEITTNRRGLRSAIEIGEMPTAIDVARLLIHVFPAKSARPTLAADRREAVLVALALLDEQGAQCSRVHGIQCVYHAAGGSTELGCGGDEPIVVQPATGALYLDPADGEIVRVVPRDVSDGDVEDGCSVVVIEVAGRSLQWRHGERVWRNMTGWVLLRDARGMVPDAVRSLGGAR